MEKIMFLLLLLAFVVNSGNGYSKVPDCLYEPIGLAREDVVADDWFSATSANVYAAKEARMNRRGWTTTDSSSSLKIKLYNPYFICGIGTRGSRDHTDNWVRQYDAEFYSDSDCTKKVSTVSLRGNSNHDKIVVNALDVQPIARCVKITATSSRGRTAMRVELYGHRKDKNANCTLKNRVYKCTCKPGTFIQPDRSSCLAKKNLDTRFWIKVAANAYKLTTLVSYGREEYEFMTEGGNETEWMYNSKGSIIADGIPVNKDRLTADVPVAYKDSSKGDDFLLFGKLKGQQKNGRQLVLPAATVYKGKQSWSKRIDEYRQVEDFVYGKEKQVTNDNLKIAGNEDHCSQGTHDCKKIAGTVCVTGDYPGTYSCLCHGGIAPVDGSCNMGASQKHQVLVKASKDFYSLGTILWVGRKTVTIKSGSRTFTSNNDEFKDYQPIDVLRSPSDEAIQRGKFVIVIDGHTFVPGVVVKSDPKGMTYDVNRTIGGIYVNTKVDNIILDGSNHALLDHVASCPEGSSRVAGRYPGSYSCYCRGKVENDRCSDIVLGHIMHPWHDPNKYFRSIIRYADYTYGMKEYNRYQVTTAYVPGKHRIMFGNGDVNYRGKEGELILGELSGYWTELNFSTPVVIEGYTKTNDLYVSYVNRYLRKPIAQQKVVDMNGCKTFGHVCGKNAGTCISSKIPTVHHCQCYSGFQNIKGVHGEQCIDVNECNTKGACGKQSTCQNNAGSYTCPCHTGFARSKGSALSDDCQDINECDLKICSPFANCENSIGSYNCSCKSGFQGDGKTCTDIDECTKDPILCSTIKGAVCENEPGSYECKCIQSGFRVNDNKTKCIDIEECDNPDACADPNAKCVEKDGGGHTCPCKDGYRTVNGVCTDYDQCKTHKGLCGNEADCEEKIGGYKCHCHKGTGYEVDPVSKKCVDTDECAVDPAYCLYLEGGKCKNSIGGASCECNTGYYSQPNPAYSANSSIPREKCVEENECKRASPVCTEPGKTVCEDLDAELGGFKCHCADGYTANNDGMCDDVDECIKQSHKCDLDTTNCLNEPGGYQCNCKPGFGTVISYILKDDENKTSCFNPAAMRGATATLRPPIRFYFLALALLLLMHVYLLAMTQRY